MMMKAFKEDEEGKKLKIVHLGMLVEKIKFLNILPLKRKK